MSMVPQPPIDAPDEEWLVYGDALQEAGDPRGELIALTHAAKEIDDVEMEEVHQYVAKNAEALLGKVVSKRINAFKFSWRWCQAIGVEVQIGSKDDGKRLLENLFASEVGSAIQRLSLVGVTPDVQRVDLAPVVAYLLEASPKSCRTLELIDQRAEQSYSLVSRDFDPGGNLVSFGPLDGLWGTNIERLKIVTADSAQIDLGKIDAPNLRAFELLSLRWRNPYDESQSELGRLFTEANWPNLESLRLRLTESWTANYPQPSGAYLDVDYDDYFDEEDEYFEEDDDEWNDGITWTPDLGPLLVALKKTKLKHLGLLAFDTCNTVLEAIAANGLPEPLEELNLSGSSLNASHVNWFEENKSMLEKLERIDLSQTPMTSQDVAKIEKVGPNVLHSPGQGARYRYVVGME